MLRTILLIGLAGGLAAGAAGCVVAAAGAAGAGTYAYVRGESSIYVDSDVLTVHRASEEALRDMGLLVTETSRDALTGKVLARDSKDRRVTVKIDGVDRAAVKVSVRVGIFGDESASIAILDNIRERL